MAMKLHVLETGKDGATGHMTVTVRVVDDADQRHGHGAAEVYGIEALELQTKFGGDVGRWLHWVAHQMAHKHRSRAAAHVELAQWQGKTIDIET